MANIPYSKVLKGQIQISNRNFFVDSGTGPRKHIRTCPSLFLEENIVAPLTHRKLNFDLYYVDNWSKTLPWATGHVKDNCTRYSSE